MSPQTASANVPTLATPIRSERPQHGVLRLTLANPPANALSEEMIAALQTARDDSVTDETIRVIVIAAEGKLFSGGHDLKQMTAHRADADAGRTYFEDIFG